jgi:hypothetical protein
MGKPITEFEDLFLTRFLVEGDQFFLRYLRGLNAALSDFYDKLSISESEFAGAFSRTTGSGSKATLIPSYSFVTLQDDCEDEWTLRLYRTELSHIAGGIKSRSCRPATPISVALAHSLVSQGVADIVAFAGASPKRRAEGGVRKSSSAGNLNLVGNRIGIYLYLKIEDLPQLHRKFRWDPEREGQNWSYAFIRSLESILGDEAQSVKTLCIDNERELRQFVEECDSTLLSQATRDELEHLLKPSGIELQGWLSAHL